MNAVVIDGYGGPEVLKLRSIDPLRAGPGELVVSIKAAGVNPVDTYLRSGAQGYEPTLPYTPGIDGAGIVKEVGAELDGFVAGDRVFVYGTLSGTYADSCRCTATQVFPLADSLSFEEGACLGVPYFTAWRALFQRGVAKSGERVLVHGASGAVGAACIQLASSHGITVFGTAGSQDGEAFVLSLGANQVFNHHNPERFSAIREVSSANSVSGTRGVTAIREPGIHLIVEMLANVNLNDDLQLLAPGGRVVVVGSRGRIEIAPRDLMSIEAQILGVKSGMSSPVERGEAASGILAGIRNGTLRPPISAVFPMAEAARAHEVVISGPHKGNIVLVP